MRALGVAVLVLLLTTPALADFVDQRTVGPAGRNASDPLVAVNGATFLAAWQESERVVLGTVGSDGSFTRTAEIPGFVPYLRALVPAGGEFVVIYTQNGGVEAVRIDSAGRIVGSPRIVMRGFAAYAASSGTRILIANEYGEATLLTESLAVLRETFRFANVLDGTLTAHTAVAASATGFLLAWPQVDMIGLTSLSTDGVVVKTTMIHSGYVGATVSAASDGHMYAVAYRNFGNVHALVTAPDGSPQGDPRVIVTTTDGRGLGLHLVWAGGEYVAVFDSQHALHRARLTRDLALMSDEVVRRETADPRQPRIAVRANELVLVWSEIASCGSAYLQVWALRWGGEPRVASVGFPDNRLPGVSLGAGAPFVLWDEVRDRSRLQGLIVENSPRFVDLPKENASAHAVAAGGAGHLVAYVAHDDACAPVVFATAIDAQGRRLRTTRISLEPAQPGLFYNPNPVAVGWNGFEFLVAWASGSRILGARVGADGTLIDATAPATLAQSTEPGALGPKLAWSFDRWILVWHRAYLPYIPFYPGPPTQNTIRMRELDRQLLPRGNPSVVAEHVWSAAITVGGGQVFIAWRDYNNIYVRRATDFNVMTFASRRGYGTSLDLAMLDGALHILDFDTLLALKGTAARPVLKLDGAIATAMAGDRRRIALAWTTTGEDGLQRVSVRLLDYRPFATGPVN